MGANRRTPRAGGLAIVAAMLAGAAAAQTPPSDTSAGVGAGAGTGAGTRTEAPGGVLSSPYEISQCLCLQRELATRETTLNARRDAYEALAREIHGAEVAVSDERPLVDVTNQLAVDEFKQQLDQLDALKTRQARVTLPEYQAAVTRYNDTVARYTQRCSGHTLDPEASAQLRANLICNFEQ